MALKQGHSRSALRLRASGAVASPLSSPRVCARRSGISFCYFAIDMICTEVIECARVLGSLAPSRRFVLAAASTTGFARDPTTTTNHGALKRVFGELREQQLEALLRGYPLLGELVVGREARCGCVSSGREGSALMNGRDRRTFRNRKRVQRGTGEHAGQRMAQGGRQRVSHQGEPRS